MVVSHSSARLKEQMLQAMPTAMPSVLLARMVGECHGQKGRFGGGAVVVGEEVHRLLVDVPEQLFADAFQFGLGVTGSGAGHIAAVGFAEVALAVHERHQQALVAPAHAHHGVIDGGVAVGVQVHGAAHDVRRLGARALDQAHFIHRIQQLAVGGLEAVDLRQARLTMTLMA